VTNKAKIPAFKSLEPKYEGGRCVNQLSNLLNRADRLPFLVHIYGSAGGQGYAEFETLAEARQAADALNYREEYVASVYDASGGQVYDRDGVTKRMTP
jgi:hypothetical protein